MPMALTHLHIATELEPRRADFTLQFAKALAEVKMLPEARCCGQGDCTEGALSRCWWQLQHEGITDAVVVGQEIGEIFAQQPSRFLHELTPVDLHWQGKDPETDKQAVRETAESHMARIEAMLAAQ